MDLRNVTLMGEYHFWERTDLCMVWYSLGGTSSSVGITTRAFLAFSSLAPSSVEPLSPHRTWTERDASRRDTYAQLRLK